MSKLKICDGNLTVSVDTCGSEITSMVKNGVEYIWQRKDNIWNFSAPVLFPICGGLKNDVCVHNGKEYALRKHGFVKGVEFTVEEHTENSLTLSYTDNEETLKMYPFTFKFYTVFTVENDALKVVYRVENRSDETMYFSVGGHEAYSIDSSINNCTLDFSHDEEFKNYNVTGPLLDGSYNLIEGTNHIDLNDDYFAVDAIILKNVNSDSVVLTDKVANKKITLKFADFTHLLIWKIVGADYVCLEPWTGLPDSTDATGILSEKDSITALEAGKVKEFEHTIIPE